MSFRTVKEDLQKATAAALGHGHGVEQHRLIQIREVIARMFKALPKNSYGRIERPMLRYMMHRYFAQRYSITIKGLEPNKNISKGNDHSHTMGAGILLDNVPAYAESVLEGKFANH